MSYQVLARKWRPQQFGQLVGQDHVKAALGNALTQNRLHHAYLFTGTRGVGKTTIARIFAKSLNCETGITATPCGVCSTCVEIEKGYYVDLLEIDAASRTKVEDTRDLLDNVQYAPSRGRFKVYLIDEVHMLSKHSFNALLKTLEEPPPHVKFLLATTDPQKLPITVLSRCLQFSLKALSPLQIQQHLQMVLQQEQIAAEPEALAMLARAARGSLRDSLSLTDQAIAQTNGHISQAAVREMLGYLEQSWAELLLDAMMARDLVRMQQHLLDLIRSHSQFQTILDDMLSLLHLAALSQFSLSASELSHQHSSFIRHLAKTLSPEQIQLYYQLLLSGKKELPYAPDLRIGVEMALLRAAAFVMAPQANGDAKTDARSAALAAARASAVAEPSSTDVSSSSSVAFASPVTSASSISSASHGAAPSVMTTKPAIVAPPNSAQASPEQANTAQANVEHAIPAVSAHDMDATARSNQPSNASVDALQPRAAAPMSAPSIADEVTGDAAALPTQTNPETTNFQENTAQPPFASSISASHVAVDSAASDKPSVDPITVSILARRGMAAVPVTPTETAAAGSDKGKPRVSSTSTSVAAPTVSSRQSVNAPMQASEEDNAAKKSEPSPSAQRGAADTTPPNADKPVVTAVSDTSRPRAPSSEADLPPWLTPQERSAALQIPEPSALSAHATTVRADDDVAEGSNSDADREIEIDSEYDYIAPDMAMLLHANSDESDTRSDMPRHHGSSDAVSAQDVSAATLFAQPIRHALLDSVPALPPTTDFAEDMANGVDGTAVLVQGDTSEVPLRFDGDINAENFAVRSSGQVDEWARQIDAMPIGGLMRIFLRHSRYHWQGDVLHLTVASSQRHLDSERNRQQLQQALQQSFGRECQLDVQFVADVPGCPQDIQQQIELARHRYVTSVLSHDPTLVALCQQFAAEIDWSSMQVH
jgi:DNA polymerase-3 subunit gamma/tau